MKTFIANWKMQLSPSDAEKQAKAFVRTFKKYRGEAVICPDFLSLAAVGKIIKKSPIRLGAQDAAAFERGAHTGEVSPADLVLLGVKYVLIGHSERRQNQQESDKLIAAKVKAVLAKKMIPVLCVGETAAERKRGKAVSVISGQLKGALDKMEPKSLRSLVVAYEPVWAIGTGVNCDAETALSMKNFISDWGKRAGLKKTAVLYGGSVKAENASSFLKGKGFDGLLVGGASLEAVSFSKIANA